MSPRSATWRLPMAVIALAAIASLVLAGTYPLIDPDEGRNAEIAAEMATGGDVIVPHLAGMPYLDKPPALFWAAAAMIRLTGPSPLAARLPALVAAMLTLALLARLALAERDARFAARAVALLAAAPLFAVLSAYVLFDMPLALCVTVIWTGLASELREGATPGRRAAMYAAIAIGILVKGPVMPAWAIGGSLGAALLMRRAEPLRWLVWGRGWLGVLAIAGGWFALATARHPEYPHYAFLEETFERLRSGSFHRERSWWFVPAVLAGGALPWSLATPWSWRRVRPPASPAPPSATARVALGFVLFAAVFFTVSRSKLVSYLLPALPPLAWLSATAWSDTPAPRRAGLILAALCAPLAFGCLAASGLAPWPDFPSVGPATCRALAIGFSVLTLIAGAAAFARRSGWVFAAALAFTPMVLVIGRSWLAAYAATQSGGPLAGAIVETHGGPVRYEACYSPGTDYALGRVGTLVATSDQWITSNYQLRYRETLTRRGQWTPLAAGAPAGEARVLVFPVAEGCDPPFGWSEIFRDRRFVAYRRSSGL